MYEVTNDLIIQIRYKSARLNLNKLETAKQIGISNKTYLSIDNRRKHAVKRTVYEKIVNWLLTEGGG